jgi:hypothetical protein
LERYFNFVSSKSETGLLVFDETDRSADRFFIRQTARGRFRATAIVPVPMFVCSDLTKAIQAADICIYALNWGFRMPKGMDAAVRTEIAEEFSAWIATLQAFGKTVDAVGTHPWYGVVFVPQPFGSSEQR